MDNSKKHILVADNDPDTLAAVRFNMKMAGYKVFIANSPEQAQKVLDEQIIHLAIIDMRLTNETEIEYSGSDVAAQMPDYIPSIIYTAYEDSESIRQALGKARAKESLDKKKPGAASDLVKAVERIFKSDVKVNFNLDIQGKVTCEEIAHSIEITSQERSQPSVADVRQILQTLFREADSIFISPMISTETMPTIRQSSSAVVLVKPHYSNGWAETRVVKFSEKLEIQQEEKNYHLINPFLPGTRMAVLGGTAYCRKIGGLIYTLIGAGDWDSIRLFSDYFRDKNGEIISRSLEQFFHQTFGAMFEGADRRSINITKCYCDGLHLTPEKLTKAMKVLRPMEITEPHLRFDRLKGTFLNPVLWSLPGGEFRKFDVISKICLCHGDLHGRNILVNSDDNYWLIDFARVDECHLMRDFVELETDLKFNIMKEADLAALLPFECALLTPKRFKEAVPEFRCESENLTKVYNVVATLRRMASKSLGLDVDMREYYEALLLNTLNMLRLRHISATKKEHALLSASLLCERLDRWPEWNFISDYGSPALQKDRQ